MLQVLGGWLLTLQLYIFERVRKEEGKKQLSRSWCSKCVPTTEKLLFKVHASYITLLLHLRSVGFGEIFGYQSLWVLKSTSCFSGLSQDYVIYEVRG